MDSKIIIQGLIFVLIVSIACAGIYAHPGTDLADNDSINNDSSDNVEGLYISGSGDVSHVPGLHSQDQLQNDSNSHQVYHQV